MFQVVVAGLVDLAAVPAAALREFKVNRAHQFDDRLAVAEQALGLR